MNVMMLLTRTPWWVYAILVYVIIVGVKTLKTHTVELPKMFIVPVILLFGLHYKLLLSGDSAQIGLFIGLLACGFVGGWLVANQVPIKIFRHLKAIELPGTYTTALLLWSFFVAKYLLGYFKATDPANLALYSTLDLGVRGPVLGCLWGRSCRFVQKYFS